MLEHGGKLHEAARRYRIPVENWLDVSTGLNPQSWPVGKIPLHYWSHLPDNADALLNAARQYYGASAVLAVAGSQAALQTLPRLREQTAKVAILSPSYAEHAHAWQTNGFAVTTISSGQIQQAVETQDVVVLVNPNNPTGEVFGKEQCLSWHRQLQQRNGWLIVDEAFMDVTPENSLTSLTPLPGLIVLRSLGKFFGLAGARVGFVFAPPDILQPLQDLLGPWSISGPSAEIARQALLDHDWQQQTREQLLQQGNKLARLLTRYELTPDGGTSLFQWIKTPLASDIHRHLAQQGILTRLFEMPSSLRFGLPGKISDWQRLETVLQTLNLSAPPMQATVA